MAAYLLKLLSRGYQDVYMLHQNYMSTEVVAENHQMLNKGSSLGDADIQRSVFCYLLWNQKGKYAI